MRKRGYTWLGAALLCGALLTGCSADGATDNSYSGGDEKAAAPAADGGAPAAGQAESQTGAAQGKDTTAEAPDLRVDQRSIIYTGSITVQVKNVDAAAAQATGIAGGTGGFIGGDDRQSGGDGTGTATLKLRIPADKFASALEQIAKLGTEKGRTINTEDVTEQVVDLDARIAVQQARVDSGRKLLGQAKSLNDLVMLEKEVATRESDLASLQAKKRRLADLTALSTVTVVLLGPDAPVPVEDDDPAGFLGGLSSGWHALLDSLAILLTVVGALLPWILVLGVPSLVFVYLRRRYRGSGDDPQKPATPPAESPATP